MGYRRWASSTLVVLSPEVDFSIDFILKYFKDKGLLWVFITPLSTIFQLYCGPGNNHRHGTRTVGCFSELAVQNSNSVCWSSTKRTSSSSHWKLTCSRHDIAEKLLIGVKQQPLTHPDMASHWQTFNTEVVSITPRHG